MAKYNNSDSNSSESNNSDKIIGILLGVLVGAFFAYLILKRNTQPATMQYSYPTQYTQSQPLDIYLQRIANQLEQMNSRLQPTQQQYQMPQSSQISQPSVITQDRQPFQPTVTTQHQDLQQPIQTAPKIQAMQNEEEWILKKDKRGRIKGISVHRKVRPVDE